MPLCQESRLALLFGTMFGLLAVALVPPQSTPDGPSHYRRALAIARGEFRAQEFSPSRLGGWLPQGDAYFVEAIWQDSGDNSGSLPSMHRWSQVSDAAQQQEGSAQVEFTNTAVYSPVNYAFSASGMALVRLVSTSSLWTDRMACLFNLVGYLGLVIAALEMLPRCRRLCLLLAFTPMMFFQASSISSDGINFALPLLLLAWVWNLREMSGAASKASLAGLGLLGLAVVLLKPTAIAWLLCLGLVPSRHFGTLRTRFLAAIAFLGAAATVFALWNQPYSDVDIARWFFPDRPPIGEVRSWLLHNPEATLRMAGTFLGHTLWAKLPQAYGNIGLWVHHDLLRFMSIASGVFLLAAIACEKPQAKSDRAWAGAIAIQSLVGFALMCATLLMTYGEPHGRTIPYMGARYLPFVITGLLVAWSEVAPSHLPRARPAFWLAGWTLNCVSIAGILLSTALQVI